MTRENQPIDYTEPIPSESIFEKVGRELGALVAEKNAAYGDSFAKCDEFLRLLYPSGIRPGQYPDLLGIVRIWDKLMRIATAKQAFGENPWRDAGGYVILMLAMSLMGKGNAHE